ncbi:mitogen-activated protein kinase kinase kinase NPK1 isoform X2 [Cornus florida]|uniref:mitogen-activated protein kinase kinase kinase NPK1 isoform X1 n=1 Tax=Cornus florida TaxID=4283 RepID=UPI00289F3C9A|nr:mitogen-activated protein kinase kinase kinase NPK1 isoform X1 [Cornus florida]XP_059649993.1 mitogen-activated protein kinase kinase kinase NPK1 isoform X2 [Cornus florida]
MQDFIGSVRRSLVFKPTGGDDGGGFGGFVEKIGSSIRRSRVGLFSRPPLPALPSTVKADAVKIKKDDAPPIRWRKGELIGCGAFGRVYMGMNLDSGELLAVKQVSIAANSASKEKTQAHIKELEEEVKLLKNLSHPNIVRYLGTAREEESLNILLEFVPGGSISSLLGKFGSFPESVIRMYTKQLLLGLEYLHKYGIMHRDIKGANILVDNKGCIKLADFGASKKVVELATMTGAKSMKGTPYWMAPEVILQTGHSFSADVWSVGCTVIEMATGKPPWSQQYQEVAALFHIGTTKSHPPIPEHLSFEAKDFLLKCLQKEPNLRPVASDLLKHPFVTGEYQETHPVFRTSVVDISGNQMATPATDIKNSMNPDTRITGTKLKEFHNMGSLRCSTTYPEKFSARGPLWGSSNYDDDDMCQIDDKDDLLGVGSVKFNSALVSDDLNKSFNPMLEPNDDWPCKSDESPELERSRTNLFSGQTINKATDSTEASGNGDNDFTFPSGPVAAEDDDEVTESKIRAFLDEKALDLKKLQTPLYEEFYNSLNASGPSSADGNENKENFTNNLHLPPKSRSPKRLPSRRLSAAVDFVYSTSPGSHSKRVSNVGGVNDQIPQEVQSPQRSEWKEILLDGQQEPVSPSASFSERQRRWKEELDEELERKREMMRQAGVVKTSSPKDRIVNRQRDKLRFFASPGK